MEKTIEERTKSITEWILRREGCLKSAGLPDLIKEELEKQKKIDIEKACDAYCKLHCYDETRWMCRNNPIARCTTFEVIKKAMEE